MKKRLLVLGGGLAGLCISKLLSDEFEEVLLLEKEPQLFGLCRTKLYNTYDQQNIPIDIFGGHVFNSTNPKVLDFVFSILPKEQWNPLARNAKIFMDGKIIGFPFEFNLYEFGKEFMERCLNEMGQQVDPTNLETYILTKYGKTACDKYFTPYNRKIWENPLNTVGTNWIQPHKTPIMDVEGIRVRNGIPGSKDTRMIHSTFYYPRTIGIQQVLQQIQRSIPNLLVKNTIGRPITLRQRDGIWHLTGTWGDLAADVVVSTIPVNDLRVAVGMPPIEWLKCHGTDFVVCETDFFDANPDITWCYFPEKNVKFHKLSNFSYFTQRQHKIAVIDAPYYSFREGNKEKKIAAETPYLQEFSFKTIEVFHKFPTYPIPPANHEEEIVEEIRKLERISIYSAGRWGLHSYDNIDVTIGKCMDLAERLKNGV